MEYILIFISAIFVNNIILSQFLGICPFLGVSKKVDTSLGRCVEESRYLTGNVGSCGLRIDASYHRDVVCTEVCA